jgi:Zn-dependent peptidase ImmA (M78 family)
MTELCTKADLYKYVDKLRWIYGLPEGPINMIKICEGLSRIEVANSNFYTSGLRGMAYIANSHYENHVILLNSNSSLQEKNYTCGHEFIHINKHQNLGTSVFSCFEQVRSQQDKFLEWQANEGSAELLVPYRKLLPLIREQLPDSPSCMEIVHLKKRLADQFQVSDAVIHYRLESLKYEIFQYLDWDRPLEKLEILSATQQRNRGIIVSSLNDIENEKFSEEFQAHIRSKNNKIIV